MAYSRGLPLMVIVEDGIKSEGLLEKGYDWYVQSIQLETAALNTAEFNGVLASWRKKLEARPAGKGPAKDPSELTVGELLGGLKPAQLWGLMGGMAAAMAMAFALGGRLLGR